MPFAIFTSQAAADAHCAAEAAAHGYPRAGDPPAPYPHGWTLLHVEPRKHPARDEWAVSLDDARVPLPPGVPVVDALSPDWTPAEESP